MQPVIKPITCMFSLNLSVMISRRREVALVVLSGSTRHFRPLLLSVTDVRSLGTFTVMFTYSLNNNERLLFCFTHYFLFNLLTNSSFQ